MTKSSFMKSAMSSVGGRTVVSLLAWLLLLPACLPDSSPKPGKDAGAGDAGLAEVADGPTETGGIRDGADAESDGMDAATPGDALPGDAARPEADDVSHDEVTDAAEADRGPELGATDAAEGGPADATPSPLDLGVLAALDSGEDVGDAGGGVDAAEDIALGAPDATDDVARDGGTDSPASDANRDGADGRDLPVGETLALDGGIDGAGTCCGCLCRDPSWSCSRDTCLDPAGRALGLAAEAGFFELAGGAYTSEDQARTSPTQRIWYSFHPAATAPESKPLAVFFNGGPGSATSAYLFCFNTAPYTLDPAFTGSGQIANNASSWTQLANLLYIDAPGAGFSYSLPLADGTKPDVGIDMDRDAAAFVRLIVRFLARHPGLQRNRVILVGESYGGTRATLMLRHLYEYQTLAATSATYKDKDLYDDLVRHFVAIYPGDDATKIPAQRIAAQFGHQVLIQPVVAGDAQWQIQEPDTTVCVANYDQYQCDKAERWSDDVARQAATNLAKLANLRQALGVEPTTIEWLFAGARTKAYGRSVGTIVDVPELTATFGALGRDDNYFLMLNTSVTSGYGGARDWHDPNIGANFLLDLGYAETFITNAKLDMVVSTPAIAPALATYTGVTSATLDAAPRTGIARPGWIRVDFAAGVVPGAPSREIRLPFYAAGGHTVTIREPANLLADVVQWYAASLAAAPVVPAPAAAQVTPRANRLYRAASPAQSAKNLYLGP